MDGIDITEARIDLAAALRMAARMGLHEGICNHFSVAVSADRRQFLVNPYGRRWSELRASDLLLCDVDGTVIEGDEEPEATAFFIHSRLHLHLPHARAVLHTHMPYATALTSLADMRLEPVTQSGVSFQGRVAYDETYNGLVLDHEEGDRLAGVMGTAHVLFLANHGVIVAGESVARAFDDLYYVERTCQNQVLAMSTGRPLRRVPDDVIRRTAQQYASFGHAAAQHFSALRRILDREEPDYAT